MQQVLSFTPSGKLYGPWVQHMMISSLHPSTPPPKDSLESEYCHTWTPCPYVAFPGGGRERGSKHCCPIRIATQIELSYA